MKREQVAWALVIIPFLVTLAESRGDLAYSLGKAFGLSASAALAASFLLGCRSHWLDRFFGSLNKSYRLHHQISASVFVLLIFHILFTALPFYSVALEAVGDFLGDVSDPLVLTGWISTALLLLGFLFSFFKQMPRVPWRWIHRIMILSLPAVIAHFYLGVSTIGVGEIIALAYLVVAFVVLILHFIFPWVLRHTAVYKIIGAKSLSPDTMEIQMLPEGRRLGFMPGQFVFLSINCTQGCGVSHEFHPYSIESSPTETFTRVAVRALGDDSRKLQHLRPGGTAILEGPYGGLLKNLEPTEKQLWIAGGIGVTPFISCVRRWRRDFQGSWDISVILLFKDNSENIFAEEFSDVSGLNVTVHLDDRNGPPVLIDLLPKDWPQRKIVISGSTKMVKRFRRELTAIGAHDIRTEEFDF